MNEQMKAWRQGPLTQAAIDAVFEQASHQNDYLVELHRLVVLDFDKLAKIDGYVQCSEEAWQYICQKAIDFDRIHHPGVMAGGGWMNYGFSGSNKKLKEGQVVVPPLVYKSARAPVVV